MDNTHNHWLSIRFLNWSNLLIHSPQSSLSLSLSFSLKLISKTHVSLFLIFTLSPPVFAHDFHQLVNFTSFHYLIVELFPISPHNFPLILSIQYLLLSQISPITHWRQQTQDQDHMSILLKRNRKSMQNKKIGIK